MISNAPVCAELELRLVVPGGPALPLLAELHYTAEDPWAVRVAFHVGSGQDADDTVEWLFARQLLTEGTARTVGEGDVRVWPSVRGRERVVNLAMTSPSGSAVPGSNITIYVSDGSVRPAPAPAPALPPGIKIPDLPPGIKIPAIPGLTAPR